MTTNCERCTRPLTDTAYVCTPCVRPVAEDLASVPSLAEELPAARWRQTRYGSGGLGGWQEPWDDRAREVEQAVTNTLTTVARDVAETRGLTVPDAGREQPMVVAARWLVGQLDWVRHQQGAVDTLEELRGAVRALRRVVDRPADSWWAGPCNADAPAVEAVDGSTDAVGTVECGADLYGAPGALSIRCRTCGAQYEAAARRDWLLAAAEDVLGHAELIARALVRMDLDITAATVRGYARHGRIVAHGVNAAGDPTYRVGDVLDVYRDNAAREAARLAKRAAKESAA